jgi:hypothetical protein
MHGAYDDDHIPLHSSFDRPLSLVYDHYRRSFVVTDSGDIHTHSHLIISYISSFTADALTTSHMIE